MLGNDGKKNDHPVLERANRILSLEQAMENKSGPYQAGDRKFTQDEWLRFYSQGRFSIQDGLDSFERTLGSFLYRFPGIYIVERVCNVKNGPVVYCGLGSRRLPPTMAECDHLRYKEAIRLLAQILYLRDSIANRPADPETHSQILVVGVLMERWRWMPFNKGAGSNMRQKVNGRDQLNSHYGTKEDQEKRADERRQRVEELIEKNKNRTQGRHRTKTEIYQDVGYEQNPPITGESLKTFLKRHPGK